MFLIYGLVFFVYCSIDVKKCYFGKVGRQYGVYSIEIIVKYLFIEQQGNKDEGYYNEVVG